ncbi:MAG TPA: trehalose-phosphatase [Verrucomicrobiae bacterium]|jgi:trehalose-phosphatase|nr:trehalose-phosphatase [Verrucomicrobiae bacterium]
MQDLLEKWAEIKPRIRGKKIVLFLDYDGTLTPIVKNPKKARISREQRRLIRETSLEPFIEVAVVSGRELGDVKKRIGIPRLMVAGNHGLELEGPKVRYVNSGADALRPVMKDLARDLQKKLGNVPGLWIEDKKLTLSVHFRKVRAAEVAKIKKRFSEIFRQWRRRHRIVLTEGKKVWEIRPAVSWDKACIVKWLLKRFKAGSGVAPIYIGDDATDEAAFRTIRGNGLAVRVSKTSGKPTAARFRLKSPSEVYRFLERLKNIKAGA